MSVYLFYTMIPSQSIIICVNVFINLNIPTMFKMWNVNSVIPTVQFFLQAQNVLVQIFEVIIYNEIVVLLMEVGVAPKCLEL